MDERQVPAAWRAMFDGEHLETKLGDAALLATTDAAGWPHVSFLSAGEILVLDSKRLALTVWGRANTATNLRELRRGALFAPADGVVVEARLTIDSEAAGTDGRTIFVGAVAQLREHRAPYAEVTALAGFRLLDPDATLTRWRDQIADMRSIG